MKKRFWKITSLIVVFAIVQQAFAWLLTPIDSSHWANKDIQEHRNEINTIFLGASMVCKDIDSKLFDKIATIDSYSMNCGTNSQTLVESYYYLLDLIDYCPNIRNVFFDTYTVSFMQQNRSAGSELQRKIFLSNRFLSFKYYFFYSINALELDEIPYYLFRSIYYKDNLFSISYNIKNKLSKEYKTFAREVEGINMTYYYMGYQPYEQSLNNLVLPDTMELSASVNEKSICYLDKIIKICQKRGINLFFTQLPVSDDAYKKQETQGLEIRNRIDKLCKKNNIVLIDINSPKIKSSLLNDSDFYDSEHLTITGSQKVTRYIAEEVNAINSKS